MIGPSAGSGSVSVREISDDRIRAKRKVLDELDIESFCEEMYLQSGRKRYLTDLEVAMECGSRPNTFLPVSMSNNIEDSSVTRLAVLVVDGTCTWDANNLEPMNLTELTAVSANGVQHQNEECNSLNMHSVENDSFGSGNYWHVPARDVSTFANDHHPDAAISCAGNSAGSSKDGDNENANLSWLLDFKLDPFIEVTEEKSCMERPASKHKIKIQPNSRLSSTLNGEGKRSSNEIAVSSLTPETNRTLSSNYSFSQDRSFSSSDVKGPKKPPFTYTELIEHALQEKGELTVSAIYQWISEHFPYYKSNDDRWKNSVRHNLSINPHFRKGSKAPHGAGHLWAIANRDTRPRQSIANNNNVPCSSAKQFSKLITEVNSSQSRITNDSCQFVTIDEVAAATASITEELTQEEDNDGTAVNCVTLEDCAEQILSGIKREVEVQYLIPMTADATSNPGQEVQQSIEQSGRTEEQTCSLKETDFLNPISKEVVAEECGLIGEGYLVTDLNPTALGLSIVDPEITPENLFGEELSFQFYELTSPSQLQSA